MPGTDRTKGGDHHDDDRRYARRNNAVAPMPATVNGKNHRYSRHSTTLTLVAINRATPADRVLSRVARNKNTTDIVAHMRGNIFRSYLRLGSPGRPPPTGDCHQAANAQENLYASGIFSLHLGGFRRNSEPITSFGSRPQSDAGLSRSGRLRASVWWSAAASAYARKRKAVCAPWKSAAKPDRAAA